MQVPYTVHGRPAIRAAAPVSALYVQNARPPSAEDSGVELVPRRCDGDRFLPHPNPLKLQ